MSAAIPLHRIQASSRSATPARNRAAAAAAAETPIELAFYRKYTEGMLRRYMYQSMEIGRMPSAIGNVSFRGRSSSRRARSFEDCVIFVHDIEKCLKKLDPFSRELVAKIALQEYTQAEAAELLGLSARTVVRKYAEVLDRLTQVFLSLDLLEVPGMR